MIKIYTDGSCLKNPGNGGWAAIIFINNENCPNENTKYCLNKTKFKENTSNNRCSCTNIIRQI